MGDPRAGAPFPYENAVGSSLSLPPAGQLRTATFDFDASELFAFAPRAPLATVPSLFAPRHAPPLHATAVRLSDDAVECWRPSPRATLPIVSVFVCRRHVRLSC
jgi:hypothetical protein